MSELKKAILIIGSVLLLLMGWPPSNLNYLLFIAFIPITLLCFKQEKAIYSFFYFYLFFFLFLLFGNYGLFIDGFNLKALVIGLFLIPFLWSLPILFSVIIKQKLGIGSALIAFPILYTLQELFQFHWDLSFIWYHLGFSMGNFKWASPLYPILGPFGVGFIIISINSLLSFILIRSFSLKNRLGYIATTLIILTTTPHFFKISNKEKIRKSKLEICVFSPSSKQVENVENNLRGQMDLFISTLGSGDYSNTDLIVGPEAYLSDLKNYPLFINNLDSLGPIIELKQISKQFDTPILIGAILVELIKADDFPSTTAKKRKNGEYFEIYNASLFINAENKVEWRAKEYLLPVSEFVPFNSIINASWFPSPRMDKSYKVGIKNEPYKLNNLRIASSICYEVLYKSDLNKNVDLHIVLSNDWTRQIRTINQNITYCQSIVKSTSIPILISTLNKSSVFINLNGDRTNANKIGLNVFDVSI